MSAKVHQFPEKLDRLAGRIKADLDRRAQSEADWVEATLQLCADLAEARAEFPDNISFGAWFDASGFDLKHQDRAAAIAMGEDLDRAREVLMATKRRSLREIHANEFRLTSPGKTKPVSEQRQRAFDVYDRRKDAGEELTQVAVQREAGVSDKLVRTVFAAREAAAAPELPELSLTAQQKLETWQRKLEADFDYRVRMASQKWLEEVRLPSYEKKIEELKWMLEWPRNAIMTKEEYNKVLLCLHPDSINSRTTEQLTEAFRLFTKYKLKMFSDENERSAVLKTLPTRAEMLARKKR